MPLVEVEMIANRFASLIQLLASASPIPLGTLDALGTDRLIAAMTWGAIALRETPGGFSPAAGTLTARAELAVRHVSTTELDANPNAHGTETAATGWLVISSNTTGVRIDLIQIDIAGAVSQIFAPPVRVAVRTVGEVASAGTIVSSAILERDDVVTLRFATATSDAVLAAPLNVIEGTGGDWAIRISGDVFAEQLRTTLAAGLSSLPAKTNIEDAPTAAWVLLDLGANWGVAGSVGLEKIDACPGLFGDVDISVSVNVTIRLEPHYNATPPTLGLRLDLSSDASDWDSLRCWLGNGGIGSIILSAITAPFLGPAAGTGAGFLASIGSLIAVGELIRLDVGSAVSRTNLDTFVKVSSTSTSATYTNTRPLPTLATTAGGTTSGATVGPLGLIVTGKIFFLPAEHVVTFTPESGQLPASFFQAFSCNSRSWIRSMQVQNVHVNDKAKVLTVDLGAVPVRVFPTTSISPANLWAIKTFAPSFNQTVSIEGNSALKAGDTGKLYLHTSAGIRRYEIQPIPDLPAPTRAEQLAAVTKCLRFTRVFMPWEKLRWLIDPPPYDYGYPPLRQWLFTFAEIPASTRLTFSRMVDEQRIGEPITLASSRAGEAAFELLTDTKTSIVLEHNAERLEEGRVYMRWLLPTQLTPISKPSSLMRSGSKLVVSGDGEAFTLDLNTGLILRGEGITQMMNAGEVLTGDKLRQLLPGTQNERRNCALAVDSIHPFSVTLPDGKIAAIYEDKLVIGVPWGSEDIIPS